MWAFKFLENNWFCNCSATINTSEISFYSMKIEMKTTNARKNPNPFTHYRYEITWLYGLVEIKKSNLFFINHYKPFKYQSSQPQAPPVQLVSSYISPVLRFRSLHIATSTAEASPRRCRRPSHLGNFPLNYPTGRPSAAAWAAPVRKISVRFCRGTGCNWGRAWLTVGIVHRGRRTFEVCDWKRCLMLKLWTDPLLKEC